MSTPRLLITGSRTHHWTPYDHHALFLAAQDIIERTKKMPVVVHGGARGADTDADRAARHLLSLQTEAHPADWNTYGRAAGPIRNQEMVRMGADLCLAFPDHPKGQGSRGTWNCIECAYQAGIPVLIVWNKRLWVYDPDHRHQLTHGSYRNLDTYPRFASQLTKGPTVSWLLTSTASQTTMPTTHS